MCVSVCLHLCLPEEGVGIPGARFTEGCGPCECCEPKIGPLQEHQMLLAAESPISELIQFMQLLCS